MSGLPLFGLITVIATVGVVVFCLVAYSLIMRRRHFKCPHCGANFKAPPLRAFFASSKGVDRLLVCPNCGAADYMEFCHDGEDDARQDASVDSGNGEGSVAAPPEKKEGSDGG